MDIAIVGAGIAGLWVAAQARNAGYSVVVVNDGAPGGVQTLASQGIIHSGLKYALNGLLSRASESIATMPGWWRSALAGQGDFDLSPVGVLSDRFYLMADRSVTSRLTTFFGGRLTAGRSTSLDPAKHPDGFRSAGVKGPLFELDDFVIDVPGLVTHLSSKVAVFEGFARPTMDSRQVLSLSWGSRLVRAQHYVFAAGVGNEDLIADASRDYKTQRRPLHQVSVHAPNLPALYVHALSLRHGNKPRVTITTHQDVSGTNTWYLGGNIAETGTQRSEPDQHQFAASELKVLFPGLPQLAQARFQSHHVDRAEPSANALRPDEPLCLTGDNLSVCWPVKLTMVPILGNQFMAAIAHLTPRYPQPPGETLGPGVPPWYC